jgi:hypothetical protein
MIAQVPAIHELFATHREAIDLHQRRLDFDGAASSLFQSSP